jgi:O-6-methylguanine DNA methyltransferase
MTKIYLSKFDWSLTPLWLAASDIGLVKIEFGRITPIKDFRGSFSELDIIEADNTILQNIKQQLNAYFQGQKIEFNIDIDFRTGTPFQHSVWNEIKKIGYGKTASYGHIARGLGNPGAVRAVGAANGANPIPIVIPCHRIVQSDGKLGGYSGGLDIKDALLRLEGVVI